MKTSWVVAAVALASLPSCKERPPPYVNTPPPESAAPLPPPKVEWVKTDYMTELRIGGSSSSELEVLFQDFLGVVKVEARRPFAIGATQYQPTNRGSPQVVSVAPWLGSLDLDELRDGKRATERWQKYRGKNVPASAQTPERKHDPVDWNVPLTVDLDGSGQRKWNGTLPPFKMHPASSFGILKGEQPLVFEGEDAAPEKPDTAFINFEFGKPDDPLVGSGTLMRDVDWIIRSEWRPTGKMKKCGGYSRIPGVAGNLVVDVSLDEVEVRVIDRRTAQVVGTKVFAPQNICPGASSGQSTAVGAKTEDIIAWVKKQLAAGTVSGK